MDIASFLSWAESKDPIIYQYIEKVFVQWLRLLSLTNNNNINTQQTLEKMKNLQLHGLLLAYSSNIESKGHQQLTAD